MSGGARFLRALAIVLIVLLGLAIVADRVGVGIAEDAAAQTIQKSQHLTSTPDVDIAGFPFLTQLASTNFDEITVSASGVTLRSHGKTLRVASVRAVMHDLTVSRDFHSVHTAHVDATASIDYADLGAALDTELRYAGHGRVQATRTITIAGRQFSGTITAAPAIADGVLSFTSATVDNAVRLPSALSDLLASTFQQQLPLEGIPFGLRFTGAVADALGLSVELTGTDLTYRR